MPLLIGGGSNPSKLYLGSTVVAKVYLGNTEVWAAAGGGTPTPLARGATSGYDAGTTGNIFVSASGNNGTGDGSLGSPYATIQYGVDQASSGNVVKVRAGTYRETVTMADGVDLERYSTEEPIITGAEVITTLASCVSGDATYVGDNWASIYKSNPIPLSSIATSDPRAAFLCEAGVPLQLAVEQPENPEHSIHLDVPRDWHTADTVNLSGGFIQSFEKTSVTDNYTQAQIEAADIAFQGSPNLGYYDSVASFTSGQITLTTTGTYVPSGVAYGDNFMLINILPAIKQGGWGYRVTGSDVIFYVWPNNTGNVASGIEYTARPDGVKLAENAQLVGFNIIQNASFADSNPTLGGYAVSDEGITKTSGAEVRQCVIKNHMRVGTRGYAPVWIQNCDDAVVENNTIENSFGQFGLFMQGGSSSQMAKADSGTAAVDWAMRGLIRRNKFTNVGHSAIRIFTSRDTAVLHNLVQDAGNAAHANKGNTYIYCHNVLWFGNDFNGANGYATFQDSSAIHWIANYIPVSFLDDGRALVDQQSAGNETPAEAFSLYAVSHVLNNTIPPSFGELDQVNAVTLGNANHSSLTYDIRNNIAHGIITPSAAYEEARSTNYNTANNDDTGVTVGSVYDDANIGDFTIRPGASFRGENGSSIAAALTTIIATMSQVDSADLQLDLNGDAFVAATPPIGCVTDVDVVTGDAIFVTQPSLSGAVVLGADLTATNAVTAGQPRPSQSHRWQRETAGVWANISGETGSSYTIVAGDVGKRLRRQTTAGSLVIYTDPTSVVASSFPISAPVELGTLKAYYNSFVTTAQTLSGIVSDGTPIYLAVAVRGNGSSAITMTATLGGVSMTLVNQYQRSTVDILLFEALAPASGTLDAVLTPSSTYLSMIAEAFEIDGVTGTGDVVEAGVSSGTTVTVTGTTALANSLLFVIYAQQNADSNDGVNYITVTGADDIYEEDVGRPTPNANYDVTMQIATVSASTAASHPVVFTSTTDAAMAAMAVELES